MKHIKRIAAVALLLSSVGAQAGLITEHWESTITEVNNADGVAVADVIQWSVTYDTMGRVTHQWNDGVNGIGEFGQGDDVVSGRMCLDGNISDPTCSSTQYSTWYSLFADAVYDLSGFGVVINPNQVAPDDPLGYNYSISRVNMFNNNDMGYFVRADYMSFFTDELSGQFYTVSTEGNLWSSVLYTSEKQRVVAHEVPEPSTLILMGLGFFGFRLVQRRKA